MWNNKPTRWLHVGFFLIFGMIILNTMVLSVSGYHLVSGTNVKQYAKERDFREEKLSAKRGTIYDRNGNVIAKDRDTYTVIAYLNRDRKTTENKPAYVTDPRLYAQKLAPILKAKENDLYKLLSRDPKKYYQTELGIKGKNLTLTQKEEIIALKLPGLDFNTRASRFYPNGVFASSTIGYSVYDEATDKLIGQLGVESTYNEQLQGIDGYKTYEIDGKGYTKSVIASKKPIDGGDVYLTLDNNIQRIVETNMDQMVKANPSEMSLIVVTDAKTNEILALSNRPTFNPNKIDIEDFNNPFVSNVFEPGSTMKIFTYAAAMDTGVYSHTALFNSKPVEIKDHGQVVQKVRNANNKSWGIISYDEGFMHSSNTGVVNLLMRTLNPSIFGKYLDRFHFYQNTGTDIPGEQAGTKVFDRKQEQYTTGFGQASTTTPAQIMQAFSAVTNKGKMMKPYITKKIVNNNKEVLLENKPTQVGRPISEATSKEMLKLMTKAIEDPIAIAHTYQNSYYTLAGKTGTAEIVEKGRYLKCIGCVYSSIIVGAPADNPVINVYILTKKDYYYRQSDRAKALTNIITNTLAYLDVSPDKKKNRVIRSNSTFEIESFINKALDYADDKLKEAKVRTYILGDGGKVINQAPAPYQKISRNQNVFLLTKAPKYYMINLRGLSKSDVLKYASLLNLKVEFEGSGYVTQQSISVGKAIKDNTLLKIKLG